ncbi:hypothetical protein BsWGS_20555 [Bradybaena similaris]
MYIFSVFDWCQSRVFSVFLISVYHQLSWSSTTPTSPHQILTSSLGRVHLHHRVQYLSPVSTLDCCVAHLCVCVWISHNDCSTISNPHSTHAAVDCVVSAVLEWLSLLM